VTVALAERLTPSTAFPGPLAMTELLTRESSNRQQFELAVRIAALLSRPIDYVDDAHCRIESLQPAHIRAMAEYPTFRGPINRAVANYLGLTAFKVDKEVMARLLSRPSSRLAVVITTAPITEVRRVAWTLAAVVLSKRIRALVLKTDRERAREAFGIEGFDIATHEAPILYPALSELDNKPSTEPIFEQEEDSARQAQILEFGLQVIGRFLDLAEPVFGELFALRMPPTVDYNGRNRVVRTFSEYHREQFLKLVRRRQQSWSAIID
jgi:hypothetical protein